MNEEDIKQDLIAWMTDFVEQPNPSLGDWPPCPYARQARIQNKIVIKVVEPDYLLSQIRLDTTLWKKEEAIVYAIDHNKIDAKDLAERCNNWNNNLLMKEDFVILEDHPDTVEYVNGVHMNFGKCALVILQKLSKLNEASDTLDRKGYYDVWGEDELKFVRDWRLNK